MIVTDNSAFGEIFAEAQCLGIVRSRLAIRPDACRLLRCRGGVAQNGLPLGGLGGVMGDAGEVGPRPGRVREREQHRPVKSEAPRR